jgi:hypothetical protein
MNTKHIATIVIITTIPMMIVRETVPVVTPTSLRS